MAHRALLRQTLLSLRGGRQLALAFGYATVALATTWFFDGCFTTQENFRSRTDAATITGGAEIESIRIAPATGREILQAVRESEAKAVLVNIWATWCQPCIEEFPELLRLHRQYGGKGVELILVSADFESEMPNVIAFLAKQGVNFLTYIKSGNDMEFIDTLNPTWSGALPATFIYDAKGVLHNFWEGKTTYSELEQKILEVLEK